MTAANIFRPLGYDNSWDRDEFKEGFSIVVNRMENAPSHTMEFDMIGACLDRLGLEVRKADRWWSVAVVGGVCVFSVMVDRLSMSYQLLWHRHNQYHNMQLLLPYIRVRGGSDASGVVHES